MLTRAPFYDFLDRRTDFDFERLAADGIEDSDYIDWNGYLMPFDYGDAEFEYRELRAACAVCDVSPLRKTRVSGSGAGRFFDHLVTRPASKLEPMQATYTVMCEDDGSLKDDAMLYKFADDDYLLLPSDVDHRPWFETVCHRFDIEDIRFEECTAAWSGLAVQGPKSAAVLQAIGIDGIEQLAPFQMRRFDLGGREALVLRLGFTGDLGYECWVSADSAAVLAEAIQNARTAAGLEIPGYGLSALQTCRIEAGFIVAGWDCSTEIDPQPGFERSPYELGIGWIVDLDTADFIGRAALVEQRASGPAHRLRYFALDSQAAPADGAAIYSAADSDERIGLVTSASYSWGLGKTLGNASLVAAHAGKDRAFVSLGGERVPVELQQQPFVVLDRRNEMPAAL